MYSSWEPRRSPIRPGGLGGAEKERGNFPHNADKYDSLKKHIWKEYSIPPPPPAEEDAEEPVAEEEVAVFDF